MVKNDGSSRRIWAYGVDAIMENSDSVDLFRVRGLFPHVPDQVFVENRTGSVDILIGNNVLGLHPNGGRGRDAVGDLVAFQSEFGSGWVIAGTHPLLQDHSPKLSPYVVNLARVMKCEIIPHSLPSFWEGDNLGVVPPKRCGKCIRCTECSDPALIHSREKQDELETLENCVQLINDKIQVTYPFKRNPHCLPNNREAVVKMAIKQENRLKKSEHLNYYNKELKNILIEELLLNFQSRNLMSGRVLLIIYPIMGSPKILSQLH